MAGSRGQDNEPNQPFAHRLAPTNGTGKHRAAPQRPAGMTRIDIERAPLAPRVAHPKRESQPTNWRRLLLIIVGLFIICSVLACVIGFAAANFISASNASSGAATTTADFLQQLSTRNYDKAFDDLGANINVQTTQDEFTREAQRDDTCYGPVTNYTEVPGSATNANNTQTYAYTITRSKLSKPYQLKLTLQQDNYGDWKITNYGADLGPELPTC